MSYVIGALDRSLVILEAVADRPGATISELATATDNTKSVVFRILHTLEARGYVIKDTRRRTYTLGYRALALAARRQEQFPILRAAEPVLDDLARSCDDNVNLIVRDGLSHLTLASRRSSEPNDLFAQVGRCGPLHVGGAPKILLAFAPAEIREQVLSGDLPAFTPKTITDPNALRAVLKGLALTGVNESHGDYDRDAFSFAAVIRGADAEVIGALSIAGQAARLDEAKAARYRRLVLLSAGRISEALGWRRLKAVV